MTTSTSWLIRRFQMARIRTVKPEFWTDEKVVECSIPARLLFIGLFNFANDMGCLERSPKRLKMQIFLRTRSIANH
ncbi:hypothetical protein LNP25_19480 [Klebsiella variicola subsp. variicola]|nr:hypothetical protein [Klebsiella variicola subsp. variicola]